MDIYRLSAILLIGGVAVMLLSFVIGPQRLYQEPDLERRVEIIEGIKTRWNISQTLIGLSLLLIAVGFVVLAWQLRTAANAWIPGLAASAFAVGTISGLYFIYRQTIDPLSSYQSAYTAFEMEYYWLAIASLLPIGIAFLQAGLPKWLGYLTAGATILYGIFFLISGIGYPTPALVVILSLVIGIVLLRQ